MTVIMAVTADEYELPVAVEDSRCKMASCIGYTVSGVSRAISRGNNLVGRRFGAPVKIIQVEIDDEED